MRIRTEIDSMRHDQYVYDNAADVRQVTRDECVVIRKNTCLLKWL